MAKFKIVVTAGDGIGPEVIAEGVKVLKAIGKKYGHTFDLRYELWAVRQSMPPAKRSPKKRWPNAIKPTLCCWAQSAPRNGTTRQLKFTRRMGCGPAERNGPVRQPAPRKSAADAGRRY